MKLSVSYVDNRIEIKGNEGGFTVDEIVSHLSSDEAKLAFREAIHLLAEEPDNVKRNSKYADILDSFDNSVNSDFGILIYNWRNENLVTLENFSLDAIEEIRNINLHISKRGRNGFTEDGCVFSGRRHTEFESGRTIDSLNFSAYLSPDGRIRLMSPEEHEFLFHREIEEVEE